MFQRRILQTQLAEAFSGQVFWTVEVDSFLLYAFSKGSFVALKECLFKREKCNFFLFQSVTFVKRVHDTQLCNLLCTARSLPFQFYAALIKRPIFAWTQKRLDYLRCCFFMQRKKKMSPQCHGEIATVCCVLTLWFTNNRAISQQYHNNSRIVADQNRKLSRVTSCACHSFYCQFLHCVSKHGLCYHCQLHLYYLNAIVSKTVRVRTVLFLSLWHKGGGVL